MIKLIKIRLIKEENYLRLHIINFLILHNHFKILY
jgi:hypothetical protein